MLQVEALGLTFASPLGVGAGLDKTAHAFEGLRALGFGFVEVGTITAVPQEGKSWLVFADTGKASPDDIAEPGEERPFEGERCDVEGRSIVILVSQES